MPSDQSLLDRLNALKASSVSFETPPSSSSSSSSSIIKPVHDENSQPISREDALAARLRSLRNQPSPEIRPTTQPPVINREEDGPNQKVDIDQAVSSSPPSIGKQSQQASTGWEVPDDVAVEEYLEALGDQSDLGFLDSEDELSGNEKAPDPKQEAQNLKELLDKLKTADREDEHEHEHENDNSDGEEMTRDVEAILAEARDEISLLPSSVLEGIGSSGTPTDTDLSLPSVPSQAPKHQDEEVDDLATRLFSLRGIGPVDAFGLPAVPTFQPDKRPNITTTQSSSSQQSILTKNSRNKYSDSDQSTWCVVCLEDATVKCEGCDDDVYCSRCWKEMHVGVRAGYEERGHRWVRFEKGAGVDGL
ncbi:Abscission/NoCut checkpoint regulator [Podospora fimiseda]|uniref:Abscission/NoCut checkpoint regulator n=1 Tax=Podospora fimiseda TaxID=252190 RepID=A0AAN7BU82_9PEZI|nr:Abscission/NoCut checkpoint regulator [Podospora fimiseda]